ncbi:unnamed protein product [Phytophthora lilii]|uniref:Unnamed protein product n=1 Tax=Phytophthora lilii TaxID=2077276 RepID=A0A9W6WMH4_9STRA|nr:unnamed protein product [Phytophthora lilii]
MSVGEGVGSACEVSEFELSVVSEDSESDPDDSVMPVGAGVGSVWLVSEPELSVVSDGDGVGSEADSSVESEVGAGVGSVVGAAVGLSVPHANNTVTFVTSTNQLSS